MTENAGHFAVKQADKEVDYLYCIFCVLAGAFAMFCALKDYDFFMKHRKAYLFVKIFGRTGARMLYVLIGMFLIALGTYFLVPQLSSGKF